MKIKISLILLSILMLLGCEESSVIPESDLVVVQAYLYAGEDVKNIRLTSTLTLDSEDESAPTINDAQVFLTKNGIDYELESSPGDSGYYHYGGDDLIVNANDEFDIMIDYNDETITAQTVVPTPPQNLSISASSLEIPDLNNIGPGDLEELEDLYLDLEWNNEDNDLYYVVIDNIEENPSEVDSDFPQVKRRLISRPIRGDSYKIRWMMVTHFGHHKVILYKINQEYADLYESRDQDSRDLNEPLTNIENGLGIFSAFNSDSVFFEAVR